MAVLASQSVLGNLKSDFSASIAVFLISIPMSLGIALASGAPMFSGLLTGIVGGVLVAPLSRSALGISGASAGLAVIVYAAINEFGYSAFLVAVVLAGCLQIFMGLIRAGVIAYYFPSSVINGMLSGIGIIVFLKQIPHALGYDRDYEGDLSFIQSDQYSSFSELYHALTFVSPAAIAISLASLFILILWEQPVIKKCSFFQPVQGVWAVVLLGVLCNTFLQHFYPALALKNSHLVSIPVFENTNDLLSQIYFPDFSVLANHKVYFAALTLALVASLETLLAVEAVDKLDIYKRVTPTNRELIAQGLGNVCLGMIGGLPLTQVIVRSSISIQAGAKTKASAFMQGVLMLLAVIFIPVLLNKIPLATLASVLLVVSYKLASPSMMKAMYKAGLYHFVPFCMTVLGLIFTNMLIGILIGLVCALFSILLENYKSASYFRESHIGNKIIFRLSEHVSFLNKANIKRTLKAVPANSQVIIDATRANYIDYDVYEIIKDFETEARLKNISLCNQNLRGFGSLKPVENARPPTYDTQKTLTPARVLAILKEGNENFVNNLKSSRNLLEQVNDTRQGQYPIAIILSCMDSRTSVELIFDQGLGDVFSVRVAGNVINDDILGSMEYACKIAGSKLIVVLGHTHCGAIKGACDHVKLDHLTGLLEKIEPAMEAVHSETHGNVSEEKDEFVRAVTVKNVELTVEQIKAKSPVINELLSTGEIGLVGAVYDIETGNVNFFSEL